MTRGHFNAQLAPTGALLVGDPERVMEKILQVNEALGGDFAAHVSNERRGITSRKNAARD